MSMPNYLKMPKKAQVLALLELGWSYRRIEAETGPQGSLAPERVLLSRSIVAESPEKSLERLEKGFA
jgi:hypothetical protein